MTKNETLLAKSLEDTKNLPVPDSSEIPGIPLYMDQVTTFMEKQLGSARRFEDEKILTKTMINNYAKNKLLPAPEKKKYSREHILMMIFIYYFKGIFSLQDIQSLLTPLRDNYFSREDGPDIRNIYDEIFSRKDEWTQIAMEDVEQYRDIAFSSFADAPAEDQELLQRFSLVCALSIDIYLKKRLIENLIDHTGSE